MPTAPDISQLPTSPRWEFGKALIDRLRMYEPIRPYVYEHLMTSPDQIKALDAIVRQYSGLIAVVPQDLANPTRDTTVRAAYLDCEYVISCGVWRGLGMDATGITADEATDRLAATVISIIQSWDISDRPYGSPVVTGDGDLAVVLGDKRLLQTRGISITARIIHPTIAFD